MILPPDLQRVEHIRDYCLEIESDREYFGDSISAFMANKHYQRSVVFSILQIVELSVGLSDEFKEKTLNVIPWSEIRGMRNIIVHHYKKVELDIVWNIITNKIPDLKAFCEAELTAYEENSGGEHK